MQPRAVGGLRPSPLRDAALGQSREVAELDTVVDIDNLLQRNVAVLSPSDLTSSGGNSKNQSFPFHQPSADTLSSQPLLLREGWQSYSANDEARVTFSPQHSLREDDRTSFLLHISFIIVRYLRAGFRWIAKFVALGLYSLFLLPGFVQIGWYYFFSPHVQRNIAYGEGRRNRLDLYIPEKPNKQKPAVAFVTGGAWIIGYKAWGSLLAQELVERDVIVACIDYRYNLPALSHHFHTRGFYRSFFLRVMEGEESLQKYSPELGVRSPDFQNAAHMLPATILFHGRADYSIPFLASVDFADALRFVHVQVTTKLYPEKTHTDLFLQDPMRGGQNQLVADILAVVHANDREAQEKDAAAPPRRRMVPECLLQLARKVSPF